MRALSTVQNCLWLGGGGGGGGLLLLAERACLPARWFTIWRAPLSAPGFPCYFGDFRLFPPVFLFHSSSVCVRLSAQRLIALAKGKMSMAMTKMGG